MSPRFRTGATAALVAALPLAAAAQSPRPLPKDAAARVDSMVRAYMAEKQPASMSVAISRGGEVVIQRAWGLADVEANRPATAATVYKIGSVSKQVTAALILKQVERGRLALTDSIGRHLTSGLRAEWRPLTIEQILNHTSGLQNDYKREGRPEDPAPTETSIAWAARDTMIAAPGARFAYSNVGYLLLGALVEKLYGKPYGAALHEEIARPLGLRTLRWCAEPGTNTMATTGHMYLVV
jgi:CubicO group peptidase (beta-lactamase class C family)